MTPETSIPKIWPNNQLFCYYHCHKQSRVCFSPSDTQYCQGHHFINTNIRAKGIWAAWILQTIGTKTGGKPCLEPRASPPKTTTQLLFPRAGDVFDKYLHSVSLSQVPGQVSDPPHPSSQGQTTWLHTKTAARGVSLMVPNSPHISHKMPVRKEPRGYTHQLFSNAKSMVPVHGENISLISG